MTSARSSGNIWRDGQKRGIFLRVFVCALMIYAVLAAGMNFRQTGFVFRGSEYPAVLRPQSDKIRVACIGDSITYGAGVEDRDRDSYPSQLQKMLGDEYQVLNYGLPGKTLQREGSDPFTKNPYYEMSQEALPAVVVIMLGTNDAMPKNWEASRYERQLEEMIDAYLELSSSPEVFVAVPPAAFCEEGKETAKYKIPPERIRVDVAAAVYKAAEKKDVRVLDMNTLTGGHREWVPDGIHPNEEGSRAIAETAAQAIRQESKE